MSQVWSPPFYNCCIMFL